VANHIARLPTHVEELDRLRIHNAQLKFTDAVNVATVATARAEMARGEWERALERAGERYHFSPAHGDGIDLATGEIYRVNRVSHGE
jgi:hypothetical protein